MKSKNFSTFIKAAVLALFVGVLLTPRTAYAGVDNGNGNGGQNNGNGNGGSVPVNGGIVFLAVAGVAYSAWKFYDLKKKQQPVTA